MIFICFQGKPFNITVIQVYDPTTSVKEVELTSSIDLEDLLELRWIRMGEFNPDNHYIYYCRQESLRRNGVALIVNKSLKCSNWVQSQKRQNLFSFPRQTIQHHGNLTLCPNH